MATPLTNVLSGKQKYCSSWRCIYRRCFASKRKKDVKPGQTAKVHVKSLFEAQRVGNKMTTEEETPARSYRGMMDHRHEQACRSVLVRVPSSPQDVCDSLQAVGPIHKAFCLHNVKDYLLVEFKQQQSVEKLMQHVGYFPDRQVPVRSRLLYAMNSVRVQRHRPGSSVVPHLVTSKELSADDYMAAESVGDQMRALYNARRLSDIGSRLRFFVCSLVEDLVRGSMPFCRIEPFGSSSNSFGWDGCDVDMMMNLEPPHSQMNSFRRFRFLTKRGSEEERVFGQQCLDVVGEMIRSLMPSALNVIKVLNARVPIIKFRHEATMLDCDLSYINLSGSKMSELMYLLGEVDPRVRVLMTTIKQWAQSCDLTRRHPGPWPANFTLLSMLVVFLQSRSPPVLPSLRHLQDLAGPNDHFILDDVDYAFVTDVSKVAKSTNTQTLDELLKEFFHFFTHFDFSSQGLSLIEGGMFPKLGTSPMHIENPLDLGHNVSNNVNPGYAARMQEAMMEALQCLESNSAPDRAKPWGLLRLFEPPPRPSVSPTYNVVELFEGEGEGGDSEQPGAESGGDVDSEADETLRSEENIGEDKSDVGQHVRRTTQSVESEKGSVVS